MAPVLAAAPAGPVGVAVSGGGDSVALLLLLASVRPVAAVTVDHGLRPESPAEAETVAALCRSRGIDHAVLRWDGSRRGNLQMAARDARTELIARWARARGLAAVALGHTLDDQAETLLLRLARGSGVDGLAAMAPVSERAGMLWLRPLLGVRRTALRDWLGSVGVGWAEDPSNEDATFARVRARAALAALAPLGLDAERLARTAARMASAREALEAQTTALGHEAATATAEGEVRLDPARLAAAPREIGLRLLAGAVTWVTGAAYRPRLARLEAAFDALDRLGGGVTLAGAVLRPVRGGLVVVRREPARAGPPVPLGSVWDARWTLAEGEAAPGLMIGALGAEGLAARPDWRERTGAARETLLTTPSIRDAAGALIAAPLLGGEGPWRLVRCAPLVPPFPVPPDSASVPG